MFTAPQRQGTLELAFPAVESSVADARVALVSWLEAGGLADAEVRDDLAVVVSELAANACHASGGPATRVTVHATVEEGSICLAVGNAASVWVPPTRRWDLDDPLRTGGRGLLIVSALMDEVRVEYDLPAERTIVTARKRLAGAVSHG